MGRLNRFIKSLKPPRVFRPVWNTLTFPPMDGVKMFFDPKGSWQSKILSGMYDSFLFEKISSLNPQGKSIYDIGAHVGFHTLYFAKLVGNRGMVAAFEPNKVNFERLKMNISENPELASKISTFRLAVSNMSGTLTFTTNDNIESGRSTGGFIDRSDTYWGKGVFMQKGFAETIVETLRVDEMADKLKLPPPSIIKIDVEGAEYQVLLGARETLARHKPTLFIEVHSIAAMCDVVNFLNSISYTATIINKDTNGVSYVEARPIK